VYRRGFLIIALLFVLFAIWLATNDFTVRSGTIFSSSGFRYHNCGSSFDIEFREDFAPGVEGSFLERRCENEARQRTATQGFVLAFALVIAVIGITRGPAPPLRSIDVLSPLPTPEEMRRSRLRVVRDVDDIR
jgi:hypothetical protein